MERIADRERVGLFDRDIKAFERFPHLILVDIVIEARS